MKPVTTSPESRPSGAPGVADLGVVDLDVTGMTCAACAARIERSLNTLDGVTASVNYATERARVVVGDSGFTSDELIARIESTGYGARLPQPDETTRDERIVRLRRRLVVAIVLGIPVL